MLKMLAPQSTLAGLCLSLQRCSSPPGPSAWGYGQQANKKPRCPTLWHCPYQTWRESSCRLWAHRKPREHRAGPGAGGAVVMARETDDNRQTDGTGARGHRASTAHPRPSSG